MRRDIHAIADQLIGAGSRAHLVAPPSSNGVFDQADAYSVAELIHSDRTSAGAVVAGVKLGFTNRTVWDALGLDSPFWSYMYTDTIATAGVVSVTGLVQPKVEPEIVLGLGHDLRPGMPRSEIAGSVAWAACGIEIVHCHYRDWAMTPADAIADAGLHAALRIGRRVAVVPDQVEDLARVEVALLRDGEVVARGVGANALGGPLDALCWLVELPGVPTLPAGSVVTTGTLTQALPMSPGEAWSVHASEPVDLGSLAIVVSRDSEVSLSGE